MIPSKSLNETLYLPLAQPNRSFAWEVFHETHRMGAFATQDECFRHALRLAEGLRRRRGAWVRVKIEEDDGSWTTVEPFKTAAQADVSMAP
jgi:hypothetical protein